MASFFAVRTALPLLGAIACAVLAGCSSSSTPGTADAGHTTHDATDAKQREDARRDATKVDAGFDAGIDSAIVDAAPNCPYDGPPFTVEAGLAFTLEAGSTWQSLYRDYFGNLATAGCAGDGNCHGGTDQFGFQASGFLCPAGDASATCYRGLTSPIDGGVVFILPDASFRNDFLSQILCTTDGGGAMPEGWSAQQCLFDGCNYEFTPTDMQRIANWVSASA